ncbi:hypothetical protein [Rhizosaccharibacter radicis]|uniref:Phage holin family protein n=1 Tax=Rhizosaccharibacter radicis TaxID=2782605 RepID=A0ABT1VU88_9PROT|nr:hypothetical protein [Acetobacteraceae bacterium KSS12]
MRVVELGKVAASAEALRLRRMGMRLGRQAAFLVLAALFGLFALISLHVVLFALCDGPWNLGNVGSSFVLLGFDAVVAIVLVLLGRGKGADAVEIEARITRDRSLAEMRSAAALTAVTTTVAGPVGRMAGRTAWGLVRKMLPGGRRRRR